MAAKNLDNIHIYDGLEGEVAVAPMGSTFQEGIGPAETPFEEVGWISEDGVSEEIDSSIESMRAWQGRKIVKRFIPEADATFTVQCLEENAVVHGLKTRGADVTVSGSGSEAVAKTVRNKETSLDQRVWRLRAIADDLTEKVYIFVGTHSLNGSVAHQSGEMTVHEYQVAPIGDVTEYTNNPAITGAP